MMSLGSHIGPRLGVKVEHRPKWMLSFDIFFYQSTNARVSLFYIQDDALEVYIQVCSPEAPGVISGDTPKGQSST